MINAKRQTVISVMVVGGCCLGQNLSAATRNVPADFATIQDCISAATTGDVCSVGPGTYSEAIDFLGKAITVRSSGGADVTIIDATGIDASVVTFATGEDANSVLSGFTITEGVGTTSSGAKFGGGIFISGASPTITNCIITANTAADGVGGGIYSVGNPNPLGTTGKPKLTNCTISNNNAGTGGGMVAFGGGPTLTNCAFNDNTASSSGGFESNNSSPTLTNCAFSRNSAPIGGGFLSRKDSDVSLEATLTGCAFNNNTATTTGGGMRIDGTNPTVTDCTFTDNTAEGSGGAMSLRGDSSPTVTNCMFSGNMASASGGAIRNLGNAPIITSCVFSNNFADTLGGGAIFTGGNSSIISHCTFSDNSTNANGGALDIAIGSPVVVDCNFSHNSSGISGGGLFNSSPDTPIVSYCTFSDNFAAGNGGAIQNLRSSIAVTNSMFFRNSAMTGGAVAIDFLPGPDLTNCAFVGNSASVFANAIYSFDSSPNVINSTFTHNPESLTPTIFASGTPVPTVTNIILLGNRLNEIQDAIVSYSVIAGGLPSSNVDGGGNIDLDPQFIRNPSDGGDGWGDNPATPGIDEGANDDFGDLRLRADSPGIDAGDNTAVPLDIADLDGDMDLAERTPVDLGGAPRFLDDQATVDAGIPDLPTYTAVVDMGAFEHFLDCNQNGIADNTEPDCDSPLWPSNGIPDECDIAQCAGDFGCGDCTLNGVPDGCDIAAGEPDNNANGIPDMCEEVPPALAAIDPPIDKDRFISLIVPVTSPGVATALRVALTSLHHVTGFVPPNTPDFSALEGEFRYVNLIRDSNGQPITQCLDSSAFNTHYACATLGCTPEFADWAGLFGGVALHISGTAIVPDSVYNLSQLPASCAGDETACATGSVDLSCATSRWGDADGSSTVDVTDIVATVDRVKDTLGAEPEYMCYVRKQLLQPQSDSPNVTDVVLHVDAVKSVAYPFAIATCP